MRCALEGAAAVAAARVAQSMNAQSASAVSTMQALATLGWQSYWQAASGGPVVFGVVVCAPVSKPCDHQPAATHRDGARPP
jgi:hypothetical protein